MEDGWQSTNERRKAINKMENLNPTPGWDDVPQMEETTVVRGGPGEIMNAQAQALLNRTAALKGAVDGLAEESGGMAGEIEELSSISARAVVRFESVAEMRTVPGRNAGESSVLVSYSNGWAATVRGATGGGLFYWDADSVEPDNSGTVFAVTGVASGRWKRRIEGSTVWVDWFGAVRNQDATNAIKAAVSFLSSIGGGVLRASGRYLLDTENININSDNIFIVGDGPGATIFERTNPAIALFMFQWAYTKNTAGGGIVDCELIGVRNPTTGNGAIAFGTSVNHANSYRMSNVVVRRWGQYGVGLYNGSNWDVDRVSVYDHGHTTRAISSCIAFNVFPRQASSGGRLRNIYAAIGTGSMANSAAIKLEQHQGLDAAHIFGLGGTEICLSLSAIGGRVSGVKCVSQGVYPGIGLRSRDPSVSTVFGKFILEDVDCDDNGFSVSMVIGDGVGMSDAVLEGCRVNRVRAAQFRVNSASSAKDCHFTDVFCSIGLTLDHNSAGITAPNVTPTGNRFTNVFGKSFSYRGDSSVFMNCGSTAGGAGVVVRGNGNVSKSMHSQGATANGLDVIGNNNSFFDLSIATPGNASVFVQSGSGNILHGISYNPSGYHLADSGSGTKSANLLQLA